MLLVPIRQRTNRRLTECRNDHQRCGMGRRQPRCRCGAIARVRNIAEGRRVDRGAWYRAGLRLPYRISARRIRCREAATWSSTMGLRRLPASGAPASVNGLGPALLEPDPGRAEAIRLEEAAPPVGASASVWRYVRGADQFHSGQIAARRIFWFRSCFAKEEVSVSAVALSRRLPGKCDRFPPEADRIINASETCVAL